MADHVLDTAGLNRIGLRIRKPFHAPSHGSDFSPPVRKLRFDPVCFGILSVVATEISLIRPPISFNVFVLRGVVGDVSTATIFRGVKPFWIADIARPALLAAFPGLALYLTWQMH